MDQRDMNQTHHHHDQSGEHEHSHGGVGIYLIVFAILVVLTGLSFWLGNSSIKVRSPGVCWAGMMAISCAKAMLVILFFMHLLWEANWKYVLTIPAMMMSVFLLCMLIPDIGLRVRHYSDERFWHAAFAEDHGQDEEHEAAADSHGTGH
jgi:cytochrome c oxidase subunit 4